MRQSTTNRSSALWGGGADMSYIDLTDRVVVLHPDNEIKTITMEKKVIHVTVLCLEEIIG